MKRGSVWARWRRRDDERRTEKAVFQWLYEGPEKCFGYRTGKRRGIDLIRFEDGKIKEKITYTKTAVEVEGKRITLTHREDG